MKTIRPYLLFLSALLPAFAVNAWAADDYGTADEAKAMLERAVEELKKDKDAALQKFAAGEEGFKDRDLYVFCGGEDGNFTAHPSLTGKSLKELQDKTGRAFGQEIYDVATEGEIKEVNYMWTRPNETEPVEKSSYVTKVGDQICAVGYYRQ